MILWSLWTEQLIQWLIASYPCWFYSREHLNQDQRYLSPCSCHEFLIDTFAVSHTTSSLYCCSGVKAWLHTLAVNPALQSLPFHVSWLKRHLEITFAILVASFWRVTLQLLTQLPARLCSTYCPRFLKILLYLSGILPGIINLPCHEAIFISMETVV